MYFFPSEDSHPLGSKWILSPEPYHLSSLDSDARYIGYSIEDACLPLDVVPIEARENRAYILAKVRIELKRQRSDVSSPVDGSIPATDRTNLVSGYMTILVPRLLYYR